MATLVLGNTREKDQANKGATWAIAVALLVLIGLAIYGLLAGQQTHTPKDDPINYQPYNPTPNTQKKYSYLKNKKAGVKQPTFS